MDITERSCSFLDQTVACKNSWAPHKRRLTCTDMTWRCDIVESNHKQASNVRHHTNSVHKVHHYSVHSHSSYIHLSAPKIPAPEKLNHTAPAEKWTNQWHHETENYIQTDIHNTEMNFCRKVTRKHQSFREKIKPMVVTVEEKVLRSWVEPPRSTRLSLGSRMQQAPKRNPHDPKHPKPNNEEDNQWNHSNKQNWQAR